MGSKGTEEDNVEKISALNEIFEDAISDASDLIKDLYWGVKTYMFFRLNLNFVWFLRNTLHDGFNPRAVLYTRFHCGNPDIFWICSNYQLL